MARPAATQSTATISFEAKVWLTADKLEVISLRKGGLG